MKPTSAAPLADMPAGLPAAVPAEVSDDECALGGRAAQESHTMKQEMLINVSQPEECRIAIVEDGVLEELYVERHRAGQLRRQHLQGRGGQPGAQHPGGLRRLRRGPQRVPAHQRRRAAIFPPGRLRSRPAARARRAAAPAAGNAATTKAKRTRDLPTRTSPAAAACAPAPAPASSRRSRKSSAAATRCWCRSSRKASAPRAPRCPPTSASPAATWC